VIRGVCCGNVGRYVGCVDMKVFAVGFGLFWNSEKSRSCVD